MPFLYFICLASVAEALDMKKKNISVVDARRDHTRCTDLTSSLVRPLPARRQTRPYGFIENPTLLNYSACFRFELDLNNVNMKMCCKVFGRFLCLIPLRTHVTEFKVICLKAGIKSSFIYIVPTANHNDCCTYYTTKDISSSQNHASF